MLECLIIGDSIAVGAHVFRRDCQIYAKGGITSHGWYNQYGKNDLSANTVIISLGTNDWEKADTFEKLKEIRQKIKAPRVFWIAPNQKSKSKAYNAVWETAAFFGDALLTTEHYQKDNIHPSWKGYKDLLKLVK